MSRCDVPAMYGYVQLTSSTTLHARLEGAGADQVFYAQAEGDAEGVVRVVSGTLLRTVAVAVAISSWARRS